MKGVILLVLVYCAVTSALTYTLYPTVVGGTTSGPVLCNDFINSTCASTFSISFFDPVGPNYWVESIEVSLLNYCNQDQNIFGDDYITWEYSLNGINQDTYSQFASFSTCLPSACNPNIFMTSSFYAASTTSGLPSYDYDTTNYIVIDTSQSIGYCFGENLPVKVTITYDLRSSAGSAAGSVIAAIIVPIFFCIFFVVLCVILARRRRLYGYWWAPRVVTTQPTTTTTTVAYTTQPAPQPVAQPYPQQPYPQQPYPQQPYPQQPQPTQPYPQQQTPYQPYPQQPYPAQQPYPTQPYPQQPTQPTTANQPPPYNQI